MKRRQAERFEIVYNFHGHAHNWAQLRDVPPWLGTSPFVILLEWA